MLVITLSLGNTPASGQDLSATRSIASIGLVRLYKPIGAIEGLRKGTGDYSLYPDSVTSFDMQSSAAVYTQSDTPISTGLLTLLGAEPTW